MPSIIFNIYCSSTDRKSKGCLDVRQQQQTEAKQFVKYGNDEIYQ